MAAIFDSVASNTSNTGDATLSWTHTLGTTDGTGLVVVCASGEDTATGSTNQNITGITFNGTAMTQVVSLTKNDVNHSVSNVIYELHGSSLPAAGNYTVTVSFTNADFEASVGGSISFKSVKPQNAEASASNSGTDSASPSTLSTSITTLTPNALVIAFFSSQNEYTASFTTGETEAFSLSPGSVEKLRGLGGYKTVATASSQTTTVSMDNPETMILCLASFETLSPAGGSFLYNFM